MFWAPAGNSVGVGVVVFRVAVVCLGKSNMNAVSFFFGAIATSVGVLCFSVGVLTVMQLLEKTALSSSSSSLQSLVVLVVVIFMTRGDTVG